ncbi:MAG: hypothetical protein NXH75_11005 [Halobacteriovoraceae bacterium]|nr:hypothetical protein [Halobacteriovoraceae bacterium]
MKTTLIITLIALTSSAFASEIDPFYRRHDAFKLEDATEVINKKTKELLADSLSRANKRSGCSKSRLYRSMRKNFRNHVFGNLTPFIIETDQIQKIEAPIETSIYQDFSWYEAPIPGLWARVVGDPSGKVLRMGPYIVGTDKFEHFLGTGYRYFKARYLRGKSIDHVLELGISAEKNSMGMVTTGVFSYADLVANFSGMRFWNHVLNEEEDVLGENLGPYIECVDEEWVQVKEIDWQVYMDYGWDEGINCSRYRNQTLTDKVMARIKIYEEKYNETISCPYTPEHLDLAAEKYGELSEKLLNFESMLTPMYPED